MKIRNNNGKLGHGRIFNLGVDQITQSPENEQLYRPVKDDDVELSALAASIAEHGVREPIVITRDNYIVSGHRRHAAAKLAELTNVPCRRLDVSREGNGDYLVLLREFNRQRVKTRDEALREEVVSVNPEAAHQALTEYRAEKAKIWADTIEIRDSKGRAEISSAKRPFLDACRDIIARLQKYWPLADRQIHYQLLNDPPLIHASKPQSRYRNDRSSYKALTDLLTRARHAGLISYKVIADATRPVTHWKVFPTVAAYYRKEFADMLNGYWRDLMQSQPNHIEIVAEKLTVKSIVDPVAANYCIPLTIGRGFCSTRPLYDIAERFRKSGKEDLVLLSISDLDPDGDEITHSVARRLRDDFNIAGTQAVKVALTTEQVSDLELPPNSERAKRGSPNFKRFVQRYGSDLVYELEAVPPDVLAELLTEAIDNVIDPEAFNDEVEAEHEDAAHIADARERVLRVLRETGDVL